MLYFGIPFGREHLQSSIKLTDIMWLSTTLYSLGSSKSKPKLYSVSIAVICGFVVQQFVGLQQIYTVSQKTAPSYFCNNFVRPSSVLIILAHMHSNKFGTKRYQNCQCVLNNVFIMPCETQHA